MRLLLLHHTFPLLFRPVGEGDFPYCSTAQLGSCPRWGSCLLSQLATHPFRRKVGRLNTEKRAVLASLSLIDAVDLCLLY